MEAIARQPEASGDIRMHMIIAAALIEGVALLEVVVCLDVYKRQILYILPPKAENISELLWKLLPWVLAVS